MNFIINEEIKTQKTHNIMDSYFEIGLSGIRVWETKESLEKINY